MDVIDIKLKRFLPQQPLIKPKNNEVDIEYPPSDADIVADKCAFIGVFKSTGLSNNEPAWYSALQVVRCCIDGCRKCHEFSSVDAKYSEDATNKKLYYLEQKNISPTLCSTLQQYGYCDNCPFKDRISSPIQTGIKVTPIEDNLNDFKENRLKERANEMKSLVPKESWIVGKEGIFRIVKDNPELVVSIPFFIVDKICESYDDETLLTVVIRYYLRGRAFNFKLPLKSLGENRKLLSEFSARSIFPSNTGHLKAYIIEYVKNLGHIEPFKVVNSMGWQSDGSFVYGSNGDGLDKEVETVSCIFDQKMIGYTRGFEAKGSLDKWKNIFKIFSDKETYNPFIFSILCSMGAPLLKFTAAKGVLVSLHGESGCGKTLAHKAALSVWGNPDLVGVISTKDTTTAMLGRAGSLKNLPLRIDEMTNFPPKQLSGLVYDLVNGRGRSRATIDGSLSSTSAEWQTVTLATTNSPLLESNIVTISEAERNRILEIEVQMTEGIFNIGRAVEPIYRDNYGVMAEQLSFIFIKYKDKLLELIDVYQDKFQKLVPEDKRFWVSCGAVAFSIGILTKALGLIDVDIKRLIVWFEEILKHQTDNNDKMLDENRGFKEPEEFIAALMDWLAGSILKLNSDLDVVSEPSKEIKARLVRNIDSPNVLYVRAPVLKAFVQQYYVSSFASVKKKMNIGSSISKRFKDGQVRCYQFNLEGDI